MPEQKFREIDPRFHFDPDWWIDPVPPWLLGRLEDDAILRLSRISLNQKRAVLKANLEAIDESLEVIQGLGRK